MPGILVGWLNLPELPTTSPGTSRLAPPPATLGVKSGALAFKLIGAVWIWDTVGRGWV